MPERLAHYVPITQWLPALRAVVPRRRPARRRSPSGRCSCRRPSPTRRWPGAPPQAGLATALAAGVAVCRLRHLPRARRRPELDDRDHRGGRARSGRRRVPGAGLHDAARRPRGLTGVVLIVAGALRLGFVSEFLARPGARRLHQRDRRRDHRRADAEAPRDPGRERQRARDALARDLDRSTRSPGWTPLSAAPRCSRCSCSAGSRRGFRGRSSSPPSRSRVSRAFDLAAHGVAVIADVPAGLPTPAIPDIGLGEIGALSGGALALALVALAESIGAARSLAAKRGYEIDPNQELVALGASNVGAGLLQGFPVDASLSRSAVGAGAGRSHPPLGARRRGADRRHDAVPDAAVRRPAAGDARRDHHRRRDRPRRRARLPAALADRPGRRAARDRRLRRRRLPRRPAGHRRRRHRVAARPDPARLPASDRSPRAGDRRDERRRGLPLPQHRSPPGVRDDPGPRPLPLLERALLRQRVVLPRRDAAARRASPIRLRAPSSSTPPRSATSTRPPWRCSTS